MKCPVVSAVLAAVCLSACTHATISSVPMEVPGVGKVYRYQGRANFAHQIAEADRAMTDQCKQINGGTPVVVDQQMRDLGLLTMGNGQATTKFNASGQRVGNTAFVNGTATTSSFGTGGGLRNMNQEILFKCAAP